MFMLTLYLLTKLNSIKYTSIFISTFSTVKRVRLNTFDLCSNVTFVPVYFGQISPVNFGYNYSFAVQEMLNI